MMNDKTFRDLTENFNPADHYGRRVTGPIDRYAVGRIFTNNDLPDIVVDPNIDDDVVFIVGKKPPEAASHAPYVVRLTVG